VSDDRKKRREHEGRRVAIISRGKFDGKFHTDDGHRLSRYIPVACNGASRPR
jgi:hypothetical protein